LTREDVVDAGGDVHHVFRAPFIGEGNEPLDRKARVLAAPPLERPADCVVAGSLRRHHRAGLVEKFARKRKPSSCRPACTDDQNAIRLA